MKKKKNESKLMELSIKHKRRLWNVFCFAMFAFFCSFLIQGPCPIREETTKITYRHHSNSSMCIYKTVEIYPEYLVWKYKEARNNCYLIDTCRYKKEDYDKLLKELSTIKFSAIDNKRHYVGGSGYSYSFEVDSVRYLFFDESYQFSGDYNKVYCLIQQFIESHKTRCEILFKSYSKWPHRKGWYGEFRKLPRSLQKYKVNRCINCKMGQNKKGQHHDEKDY